jgi:hypothetical protein
MKMAFFSVLSLALHLLLLLGLFLWKPQTFSSNQLKQRIEVVYIKKNKILEPKKDEKTFVKELKIPENLKFEDPATAQFSSETRQRVLQETRAQISGLTKNRERGPK